MFVVMRDDLLVLILLFSFSSLAPIQMAALQTCPTLSACMKVRPSEHIHCFAQHRVTLYCMCCSCESVLHRAPFPTLVLLVYNTLLESYDPLLLINCQSEESQHHRALERIDHADSESPK